MFALVTASVHVPVGLVCSVPRLPGRTPLRPITTMILPQSFLCCALRIALAEAVAA
jgi:hypothetical protein